MVFKRYFLSLIIGIVGVQEVFGQQALATQVGPEGIYILCPSSLPKGFSYLISRQEAGATTWEPKATLTLELDSALVFAHLQHYAQANAAFPFPASSATRQFMWDLALKARNTAQLGQYSNHTTYLQALGAVWYDQAVKPGSSYQYELRIVNGTNAGNSLKSNQVRWTKPSVPDLKLKTARIQPFGRKISLYYKADPATAQLVVYRSTYLQGDFERLNALAGIVRDAKSEPLFLVSDTTVDEKMTYQYFAIPIDRWGNLGRPSDTVRVGNMVTDENPVFTSIRTTSLEQQNAIKIAWKFAETPFIRSISIYRSKEYDGKNYQLVAQVGGTDTTYLDKQVVPVTTYYYSLVIHGAYGKSTPSARISGMLKANQSSTLPPQGLTATNNSGVVQLTWQRTDPLTYGYYVFRKESTGAFKQISTLITSSKAVSTYQDTLRQTTASVVSYAVKALNSSYQLSNLSDSVQVANGGTLALKGVNTLRAQYRESKVQLYWDLSEIHHEALGFALYRRDNGGEVIRLNPELVPVTTNYYEDSLVKPAHMYEYQIEVQGNNKSVSPKRTVATLTIPSRQLLSPGAVRVQAKNNTHVVVWNRTQQSQIKGYHIYRVTDNQQPEKIGFVKVEQDYFVAKELSPSRAYQYAVVCLHEDGSESPIEEWMGVRE